MSACDTADQIRKLRPAEKGIGRFAKQQSRAAHVSCGSLAGITASQQQWPLHLNQQTLRTHQIIDPCARCFHIHLYVQRTQRGSTYSSLWLAD